MTADFARTRRCALLLALLAFASAAHAEPDPKPQPQLTTGPAEALSAQQLLAIRLKRDADPGTRPPATVESRATKITDAPLKITATIPAGDAAADPHVAAKLATWRSLARTLGPLPRSEWTQPAFLKKPADRTISRPLTPEEAAARGADHAGARR
jgi:hypothetical protein